MVCLSILALLAWLCRKNHPIIPVIFSVFLILHITLLRRAPGYDETIKIHLRLLPNVGVWADINDIVFNTAGTVAGVWTAKRLVAIH